MTPVDVSYPLARPLGDDDLDSIARVHGVYGIRRVTLKLPDMDGIQVEYDASRMMRGDVEAALIRNGIPILRPETS